MPGKSEVQSNYAVVRRTARNRSVKTALKTRISKAEKLINKKYNQWTPQDIQALYGIYGEDLQKFIFEKEYKNLKELESQEVKYANT